MRLSSVVRLLVVLVVASLAPTVLQAAEVASDRAQVTALADQYVAEYKVRFPMSYAFSGLPMDRHDGLDINAPSDLQQWREFERSLEGRLQRIQPDAFADQPEWVTWHFLNQALKQGTATDVCRNELWRVSALGWQAGLTAAHRHQPVGDRRRSRAGVDALAKDGAMDRSGDREPEGRSAARLHRQRKPPAKSTLEQLDDLVDGLREKSGYLDLAERDKTPGVRLRVDKVIEGSVLPALQRYRNFLRDEYLPHARASASIESHPTVATAIEASFSRRSRSMPTRTRCIDVAVREVERERAIALDARKEELRRQGHGLEIALGADAGDPRTDSQPPKKCATTRNGLMSVPMPRAARWCSPRPSDGSSSSRSRNFSRNPRPAASTCPRQTTAAARRPTTIAMCRRISTGPHCRT